MAAKKPLLLSAASLGEASRLELLTAVQIWSEASTRLASAIADELAARLVITEKYGIGATEGTNTISLGDGRELKLDKRINRKVDPDQYEGARAFALANSLANEHAKREKAQALLLLLDKVFALKPSLATGEWKGLTDAERRTLADIVEEKPGTPGLKLEVIK